MRQDLIAAKVAIEGRKRVFYAETAIAEGGVLADLSPEELAELGAILRDEEAIDAQLADEEYAAAYDICVQKFPDFL